MEMADAGPQGDDAKRQGLLSLNDLTYLLEPDLSVATNVTHKNHFFQGTEYTQNQRAVCIINSGADYIDTRTSYLKFKAELTVSSPIPAGGGGARVYFGQQGSAVNLIKNITVTSRSGDEICRITDVNRLQNMISAYRYDTEWADTVGQAMGYNSFLSTRNTSAVGDVYSSSVTTGYQHTFCIPLYCLTDFFGYGRLMPSMIMSGLRIEIEFEDLSLVGVATGHQVSSGNDARFGAARVTDQAVAQAVGTGGGTYDEDVTKLNGYKIIDPVLTLKSVQLTDATQRALNELSATNGLELVYTDFERTETVYPAPTNKAHVEIRKACSRALSAIARVRVDKSHLIAGDGSSTLSLSYKDSQVDSFASEPSSSIIDYQWQLGSLYFPQQPIKGNVEEVAMDGYLHTVDAFGKLGDTQKHLHCKLAQSGSLGSHSVTKDLIEWVSGLPSSHCYKNQAGNRVGGGLNFIYDPVPQNYIPGTFRSYGQTWAVSLERSSMFELAGVPINNSRVLALRMQFDSSKKRTIDVYLKYVKLARLFLNNVEIEQ